MDHYLVDQGLFRDNPYYDIQIPESMVVIENWMATLDQYRTYAQPHHPSWFEYVQAVFNIFQFAVERIDDRLLLLKKTFGDDSPIAIVGLVYPGEDTEYIIPGFRWSKILYYSGSFYKVEWGIVFTGTTLRFHFFQRTDYQFITLSANIENILIDHRLDSFLEVCKVFSAIKQNTIQNPHLKRIDLVEVGNYLREINKQKYNLTKRELEILNCFAAGKGNKEIGTSLELSDGVIRNYISSLYKKLKVNSRDEAIKLSKELKLI